MREIIMWYFIFGLVTSVIGVYRGVKGKQSAEPDELTSLSWFVVWWVWLPIFIVKFVKKYFKILLDKNKLA